jgi:hypothetical protein
VESSITRLNRQIIGNPLRGATPNNPEKQQGIRWGCTHGDDQSGSTQSESGWSPVSTADPERPPPDYLVKHRA